MTAFRIVVIILIFTLFSGCGPELRKPAVKKAPIVKKQPSLLEPLIDNTFLKNIKLDNYHLGLYNIIDNNILYSLYDDNSSKLILADIETGKQIWLKKYFSGSFNFRYKNYLFGSRILDINTGNTTFLCVDEIKVECDKDNSEIIDEKSILVYDNYNPRFYKINFMTGKVEWEIIIDNEINRNYNVVNKIYRNGNIFVYTLEEHYSGKPDASPDMCYKPKLFVSGLIAIDIEKGSVVYKNSYINFKQDGSIFAYAYQNRIACLDLLTLKNRWVITLDKPKVQEYQIIGVYKTNIIASIDKGVASIDGMTGTYNWLFNVGNPDHYINYRKLTDRIFNFELDIGRYIIFGDSVNYHYFYDCSLDLNTGVVDKQLIKDDTGKEFIIGESGKKYGDITLKITQKLSKTDPEKSHTTIAFSDSETKAIFESNNYSELCISPLEAFTMDKTEIAYCYRYYEYETINNIRKINGKFIVETSLCNAFEFEKGKEVKFIDMQDCEDYVYKKYIIGNDELEIRYDMISIIRNGKWVWKSEIKDLRYDYIPYFDGDSIYLSYDNGTYIVNAKSGKFENIIDTYFLNYLDINKKGTICYLIKNEDNNMTIMKLKKSATELKVIDQKNSI